MLKLHLEIVLHLQITHINDEHTENIDIIMPM